MPQVLAPMTPGQQHFKHEAHAAWQVLNWWLVAGSQPLATQPPSTVRPTLSYAQKVCAS
jgi:hypothetical protein